MILIALFVAASPAYPATADAVYTVSLSADNIRLVRVKAEILPTGNMLSFALRERTTCPINGRSLYGMCPPKMRKDKPSSSNILATEHGKFRNLFQRSPF